MDGYDPTEAEVGSRISHHGDAPIRSLSAVGKRITFGFCSLPLPFMSNILGGRILRQTV